MGVMEQLGERLRGMRLQRDLSQGQVAEYAQVSQSTLSDLERGLISPKTLVAVANLSKFFGTTTDFFLGITDDPSPRRDEPLPDLVREVVELALELSPGRQQELLAHARVLTEAERAADVREYDRMMAIILALPDGERLAQEVEDALRLDAAGDAASALRLIDDIVARWRRRAPEAEAGEQAVEHG